MKKSEFVQKMYQAGLAAGLTDAAARVTASQAAVESGYGKHAPGNNYFGIKAGKSWDGPTQRLWTHEVVNGQTVRVRQTFRKYDTPEDGVADRIKFMDRAFPAFSKAQTVGEAFNALQNGRFGSYATANRADYESALNHVNTRYLGGTPVPPMNIPAVGTQLDVTQMPPMPRPRPDPGALGTFGGRLPSAAMNGVDRTNTPLSQVPPDQVPQSFLGAPFPTDQTMSMLGPSRDMSQPNMMGRNSPPSMQALGTPVGMDRPTVIAPNVSRETTVTKTILNPAYTKWEAQYGHGGANVSGSPDDRGIKNASGSPDERGTLSNIPPAPPQTIKVQVPASQNIFQQFGGAIQQGITNDVQGLQNTGNSLGTFATQTVPVAAQQAKDAVIRGIMMSPAERGAIIEPFLSRGFTDKAFTTVNETPTKYGTTFLDRQAQAQQRAALSNFGQQVPMTSTGVGTRLSVTPSSSRNRNSGSGGIQQPSGGGQTFKGSKTGREYTVGRTYQNGNGTYVAQANGTFQRI